MFLDDKLIEKGKTIPNNNNRIKYQVLGQMVQLCLEKLRKDTKEAMGVKGIINAVTRVNGYWKLACKALAKEGIIIPEEWLMDELKQIPSLRSYLYEGTRDKKN